MSLFNYLPTNAFRLIYGVSIICCQEIGKHIIFVTMNLAVFSSVTRSCGKDILSILVRNNKKCLPKLLFISLIIYRRLRSLPVERGVPRTESALVGEERRGTAVFAGSITNRCLGNAPALLSRTGC